MRGGVAEYRVSAFSVSAIPLVPLGRVSAMAVFPNRPQQPAFNPDHS